MRSRLMTAVLLLLLMTIASANDTPTLDVAKTVIKVPIAKGVSMDEAIDSLLLRANALNMKLVGHHPLYEEYKALGLSNIKRTEIFQFCDAKIAKKMIEYEMSYAAYMPCRITLVEDKLGKGWFVMMDLNILIQSANLPPALHSQATKIRDNLMEIVKAGANGEL